MKHLFPFLAVALCALLLFSPASAAPPVGGVNVPAPQGGTAVAIDPATGLDLAPPDGETVPFSTYYDPTLLVWGDPGLGCLFAERHTNANSTWYSSAEEGYWREVVKFWRMPDGSIQATRDIILPTGTTTVTYRVGP